jgi:hypothetical protein
LNGICVRIEFKGKKKGPSFGRAEEFAVRVQCGQSLIRSHANDPGPKDVVVVRVMMTGGDAHGRNVIRR